MFLRFTKKFSRPKIGFVLALLMLFAPAFIATTVESAEESNARATPTPKKKATPTPKKTTQAKTKPTPKKTPTTVSKSKTTTKNVKTPTTSKSKTSTKVTPKTTAKTTVKNTKTGTKTSSKPALTANNKTASKNRKTDKNAKTADKNAKTTKPTTADKNKTKPATTKTTKPATPKTTAKTKPKTNTADKTTDKTTEKNSAEFPQIIVTTFSVPVRSRAKSDAPTVSNVKLGTVLRVTEKNPAWYKVQYSAGGKTATGWISANSVNDLNASGKTEIYHQIVERNYKPQALDAASKINDALPARSPTVALTWAMTTLTIF